MCLVRGRVSECQAQIEFDGNKTVGQEQRGQGESGV